MSACGERFQTNKRGSERRFVRGDATGGKESTVCMRSRVCETRRKQGQDEVKLTFIDVKKEDFNAKYDEG